MTRTRTPAVPRALQEPAEGNGSVLRVAIILGVVAANLAVFLMAGLSLRSTHQAGYERVDASIHNLVELIERDVTASLDKAGIALGLVTAHLEDEIRANGIERGNLWSLVDQATDIVPGTSRIGVFDAEGRQVCGKPASRCRNIQVADRAYFARLRDEPNAGTVLDGPYRDRYGNEWSLFLARGLRHRDGRFAGVVTVLVPVENIKRLFASLSLGDHGAVNLRTADLVQVVRHPGPVRSDDEAVNRKVSPALRDAVRSTPAGGFYDAPTALDGIERRNAFRRFAKYPLYILVGRAPVDFLDSWKNDVAWTAASCALFLVATTGLAILLLAALRRREASASLVKDLLAERSAVLESDAVAAAKFRDRRVTWASGGFAKLYGYEAQELVGQSTRIFYPDDESFEDFGRTHLASVGEVSVVRLEMEQRRKDGTPVWVDASICLLDASTGETLATLVDVTEGRRAREAIEEGERRLRLASQAGGIGFWSVNLSTGKAWRSARHAEIFGHDPADPDWSLERMIGCVVPADRDRVRSAVLDTTTSGPVEWTARIARSDGAIRHVLVRGESVREEGGKVLRRSGAILDITEQVRSGDALRRSERRFALASAAGGIGVFEVDLDTGNAWRSDSHARIFGYASGEAGWTRARFLAHVVPEDRARVDAAIQAAGRTGNLHFECRIARADGAVRWIEERGQQVGEQGQPGCYLVGTVEDITERRAREDQMRFHGEVLRNMQEGVSLVKAGTGEIVYANPMFESLFGYDSGELIGTNVSRLNAATEESPEAIAYRITVALSKWGSWQGDVHNVRKDGTPFWTHACVSGLRHGEFGNVWVIVQGDIDARKRLEMGLREANTLLEGMALRDPLTGLFNRRFLDETVVRELLEARRSRMPVAFLMVDIDHFKRINDTHGHRAGDDVLKALGRLIGETTRGSDVACRIGGEEFLLMMPGLDAGMAVARAEKLRGDAAALRVPGPPGGLGFTVSIGVADFAHDRGGDDGPSIIARADRAMYAAKAAGRNCVRRGDPARAGDAER